MTSNEEVANFIRTTFRSVWSLELLIYLSDRPGRGCSRHDLVTSLRASELIVSQSLDALIAAGLVSVDDQGEACYLPAAADLDKLTAATKLLYARTPDAVRRLIISSTTGGIAAFADAFRLRKD
jgi:hypothetical protein